MMKKQFEALCLYVPAVAMLAITPLVPASGTISLSLCGANGVNRTISVPLDPQEQFPDDCAKACHSFCSRKQSSRTSSPH
ncbi:hypothetical protein AB1K62_05935 [Parasphingorhabdus sp. JC815]|uniref:hypothetical protein n=1 Tax=Parasphingorhabdus sp. JC815 TaxID=3232140 RepID=UPI003459E0F2